MLIIRLQRVGKKNQASFRIVLAEKYRSAKKQIVELLGHYNPRTKEFGIKDQARLDYWVGQHVEISPTTNNLLVSKGLLKTEKVKAWRPKIKEKTEEAQSATPVTPTETATVTPEVKAETPAESPTEKKTEETPTPTAA